MNRVIGGNLVGIETHQDKKFLKFRVTEFEDTSKIHDVIFSNNDNTAVNIDFSYFDIGVVHDPDDSSYTFGEFEYVKPFEGGFEVFGDFGIIWVYCDSCSLPVEQYS
jgi:hypothetical protein